MFRRDLLQGIVVESTYNWYWLVDGLMDKGHKLHLANTAAIQQYAGLKYTDDNSDVRWLVHILRLGVLPQGYFYPKHDRAVRDLLRKRSQTLKYEVLKRARFRCELCGISADEKALEVDQIVPRNHGGFDDFTNFQALCYSCNAMKRDRDNTDFRKMRESYDERQEGCLFSEINKEGGIAENELAYAIGDGFPVTPLHTLVIPKRHTPTYFELSKPKLAPALFLSRAKNNQSKRRTDPFMDLT
jgi:hypothetical protein